MTFPKKTSLAILCFVLMAVALQYVPMAQMRMKKPRLMEALDFGPPPAVYTPPKVKPLVPKHGTVGGLWKGHVLPGNANQILDPTGAMEHFYAALRRTDRKEPGAITRILHYGDSPVTADSITADARAILQKRFGDAGHGFVLIAKPWAWYGHRGVELKSKGWRISPATQSRAKDGLHGLGGVSFEGAAGATSTITLPDDLHTRMEVDYLRQPGGGSFHLESNGQTIGDVETAGETKESGFAQFPLPPGSRHITLTVTSGTARLFGWSFEKDGPGVIYHSLGLNGAQVQAVVRFFDAGQWATELQHQKPDLVVINYGTNESVFPAYIEKQYPGELRKVIERVKHSVPEASVLIMSPMDRGERDSAGDIITVPVLPRIVEIQKETGIDMHCAFFDTYEAMGGAGTMGRWYESQPRMVGADFTHPLPAGAARVGTLLDDALMRGFVRSQAVASGAN